MLLRLQVSGFKNLREVDVRFGPFTCIAGENGVGKSNLLDAIAFLGALTVQPFLEAAASIRDAGTQLAEVQSLFSINGAQKIEEMTFVADILAPSTGKDGLNRDISAVNTYLRYTLVLAYRLPSGISPSQPIGQLFTIVKETLEPIVTNELVAAIEGGANEALFQHFSNQLGFPTSESWRQSAYRFDASLAERRDPRLPIIDTLGNRITLYQDKQAADGTFRGVTVAKDQMPRTMLSVADSLNHPTAYLVREEMRSWAYFLFEPSALRKPDTFALAPGHLDTKGTHLPSTLLGLVTAARQKDKDHPARFNESQTIEALSRRLLQLTGKALKVAIDVDEQREIIALKFTDRSGHILSARSISDGSLRFLALAILELDPHPGLYCIDEPENGVHPGQIPGLIQLLLDIATDPMLPIDVTNVLHQVIITTHSPAIVAYIPDDTLLVTTQ